MHFLTPGAFVMVLAFMLVAGMNSKATFQSLIASLLVIEYPTRFVNAQGLTGYGAALLLFWIASIYLVFMRN